MATNVKAKPRGVPPSKIKVGDKFGRLTVKRATERRYSNGCIVWECKCECKNTTYVDSNSLSREKTKSCGCLSSDIHKDVARRISVDNFKDGTNLGLIKNLNKPRKNNQSGVRGVYWHTNSKKWCAKITFKNKSYFLGRFDDFEKAVKARKDAENKYFGEFIDDKDNKSPTFD